MRVKRRRADPHLFTCGFVLTPSFTEKKKKNPEGLFDRKVLLGRNALNFPHMN